MLAQCLLIEQISKKVKKAESNVVSGMFLRKYLLMQQKLLAVLYTSEGTYKQRKHTC